MSEDAVPAEVVAVLERVGTKGVIKVRAKIKDPRGRVRVITRNVLGPVRVGDILMVTKHDLEASGELG